MDRRAFLATASVSPLSVLAGCLQLRGESDEYDIGMSANAFQPDELTISVGDTVTWKNDGSRAHTVTAYEGGLPEGAEFFATGGYDDETTAREAWHTEEGGNLYAGERFEHEFLTPGRHLYFCVPHEPRGMTGRIEVEE